MVHGGRNSVLWFHTNHIMFLTPGWTSPRNTRDTYNQSVTGYKGSSKDVTAGVCIQNKYLPRIAPFIFKNSWNHSVFLLCLFLILPYGNLFKRRGSSLQFQQLVSTAWSACGGRTSDPHRTNTSLNFHSGGNGNTALEDQWLLHLLKSVQGHAETSTLQQLFFLINKQTLITMTKLARSSDQIKGN